MKRIYIFGLLTRIFMLFSILFVIYLGVYGIIYNVGDNVVNIILVCLLFVLLIFAIYWQWTVGIFVKGNRLVFSFHLNKSENIERTIADIQFIGLEKEKNRGFNFIITYKNGTKENLFYKFYRVSFIESIQYRRIRKKLIKLNQIFEG